jgi:hypothetical protein
MNKKRILKYGILLISLISSQLLCAEEVGLIQYTHGAVIMQNMDGSNARLVAKNTSFQRGEVLLTGDESFIIVKLKDETRLTLRSNSSFSVEQFNPAKDSTASATLRLFRGGVRVISGYIGKRNADAYKIKTNVATLGVHGAVLDVRLCKDDCEEENKRFIKTHDKTVTVEEAAPGLYVSLSKGKVSLKNKSRLKLNLKAGQSAHTDVLGRQNKRLSGIPMFQQFDIYPMPDVSNSAAINVNVNAIDDEASGIVCESE